MHSQTQRYADPEHAFYHPQVSPGRHGLYQRFGKRGVDLALVFLLLPIAAPLVALLWLAARLEGGQGLFGHVRVGKDGQKFTCWKIRSMRRDAEALLERHLQQDNAAADEWARCQKLADDPRITRLGRIFRRTSLDELPQIWNVARGEMSFVGPRPVTSEELQKYGVHRWTYAQARPGITGAWQVTARGGSRYDDRIILDVGYIKNANLFIDIAIICKTVISVLRLTGQ